MQIKPSILNDAVKIASLRANKDPRNGQDRPAEQPEIEPIRRLLSSAVFSDNLLVKFCRATDCSNIFSLACKLLMHLPEEIWRATDEACLERATRAIMGCHESQVCTIVGFSKRNSRRTVAPASLPAQRFCLGGRRSDVPRNPRRPRDYPREIPGAFGDQSPEIPGRFGDSSGISHAKSFRFGIG
jgi:hypothetical protein